MIIRPIMHFSSSLLYICVKIIYNFATKLTLLLITIHYATYYNEKSATILPPGVKADIVTGIDENGNPIYKTIADGDTETNTVPAGTAVVLSFKQNNPDSEPTLAVMEFGGDDKRTFDDNLLHGSDEPTETSGGETYYKLDDKQTDQNGGWIWGSENGESFESGEHQAWLVLPTKTTDDTPLGLPDKEDPEFTSIQSIVTTTSNDGWYTINGVKLDSKPTTTGIYIYNGRKIVIK